MSPQFLKPARAVLALAIIVYGAWLCAAQYREIHAPLPADDETHFIDQVLARFALLEPYLTDCRIAGYIASRRIGASPADEMVRSLARFALAPVVLCARTDKPIVVANFDTAAELDQLLARGEFSLVARIEPGLAVLKRVGP